MIRNWEYFYFSVETIKPITDKDINKLLTDYGKGGWELVNVVYDGNKYAFFFKRPL